MHKAWGLKEKRGPERRKILEALLPMLKGLSGKGGWQKGQKEGWQKGLKQGQQELILKMLKEKVGLSVISRVTGLLTQEIKKLKNDS